MADCIFCKLVAGDLPSHKLYEDANYLAVLDIMPQNEGQSIVIYKKHTTSYFADAPQGVINGAVAVAQKLAKVVDKLVGARSVLVVEGLDVSHFHVKFFPLKGREHLTTKLGPKANPEDLKQLAQRIREVLG